MALNIRERLSNDNHAVPIRQVDMDDNLRIWRDFQFGDLFDLLMLDTRVYDRSITDMYWNTAYIDAIRDDASRSLMGPRQETWFYRKLRESSRRRTAWRIVGSQVLFSRVNGSEDATGFLPTDGWDAYQANRNRTLQTLYGDDEDDGVYGVIGNNVFLAGDVHSSYVSDLVWLDARPYDPMTGVGAIGVEFGGTAITSPGGVNGNNGSVTEGNEQAAFLQGNNRELQWQDSFFRGYFELSVGYDAVNASFFGTPVISSPNGWEIPLANFTVKSGENRLHRGGGRWQGRRRQGREWKRQGRGDCGDERYAGYHNGGMVCLEMVNRYMYKSDIRGYLGETIEYPVEPGSNTPF